MRRLLLSLLLLSAFVTPAWALLDEVSWQATRVMRIDGRRIETRVHHTRLRERISTVVQGVELDLILRFDQGLMWQMTPLLGMANQTDISGMDSPANIRVLSREKIGQESVAGQPATRYRLRYRTRGGADGEGEYWQNAAGVHVRSRFSVVDPEGRTRHVELELADLRVVPQDESLFEPPADYSVIRVDAGALLRELLGF